MLIKIFKDGAKLTVFTISICLLSGTTFASFVAVKEDGVVSAVIKNGIGDDRNTKDAKKAINETTEVKKENNAEIAPKVSDVSSSVDVKATSLAKTKEPVNLVNVESSGDTVSVNSTGKIEVGKKNEKKADEALNEEEVKLLLDAENKAKESLESNRSKKYKAKTVGVKKVIEGAKSIREMPFADNEQISVVLSNRDINRVLVKGDKIQSVNGPTGLYMAKNDATGSAYISLYGESSFTIFISTLKGHNFSLLVTPIAMAGRTVILESTTLLTSRFEESESYQKTLVDFITSMINSEVADGYAYGEAKKSKKVDFYGIADVKQLAFYSGSHLVGIVSEVKNKSKKPITLKPSYFYHGGVRAVALSQQTIAPAATGLLYQVIGRD